LGGLGSYDERGVKKCSGVNRVNPHQKRTHVGGFGGVIPQPVKAAFPPTLADPYLIQRGKHGKQNAAGLSLGGKAGQDQTKKPAKKLREKSLWGEKIKLHITAGVFFGGVGGEKPGIKTVKSQYAEDARTEIGRRQWTREKSPRCTRGKSAATRRKKKEVEKGGGARPIDVHQK